LPLLKFQPSYIVIPVLFYIINNHRISTADLPANTQSNFIIMLNTQYVKYHILILS